MFEKNVKNALSRLQRQTLSNSEFFSIYFLSSIRQDKFKNSVQTYNIQIFFYTYFLEHYLIFGYYIFI